MGKNSMSVTIGIDPGKRGAACGLRGHRLLWVKGCPLIKDTKGKDRYDERAMVDMLKPWVREDPMVIIEKVHSMPKQGVVSAFTFGYGVGVWVGIIIALGFRHEIVTPQDWKRDILRNVEGGSQKVKAVLAAKRLFPELAKLKSSEDGKAEAALMALYGWKKWGRGDV